MKIAVQTRANEESNSVPMKWPYQIYILVAVTFVTPLSLNPQMTE